MQHYFTSKNPKKEKFNKSILKLPKVANNTTYIHYESHNIGFTATPINKEHNMFA